MILPNQIIHCKAEELLPQLDNESVDLIITDPPYGCGKQVSARRSPSERFPEIEGIEAINNLWLSDAYRTLKHSGAMYVFAKWVNMGDWKAELENVGFSVRNCIVWDKVIHGLGDVQTTYAPQYEFILFAAKGRHLLRNSRPIDIIRVSKVQPQNLVHPYEKPVELLMQLISNSSDIGDLVLDPFLGSGTTLLAAQKLGRNYLGCDISLEYCELARQRLALPFTPNFLETMPIEKPIQESLI